MPYSHARDRGRQPFEVIILIACVLTGLVGLFYPPARSPVIVQVLGDASWVWPCALTLCGAVPLIGLIAKPPTGLIIERAAMVGFATLFLFYGTSLFALSPPSGWTAAGVTSGYGLAALFRAHQITKDLNRAAVIIRSEIEKRQAGEC